MPPSDSDIFLLFRSYLSPSFSSSITLHPRLHTRKDAPLSFDIVDRIEGNPLFFCCFSFPFFLMSDCLEMLVRVLGFRIVWLGGKYEKMKSINPQMFLQELLPSLNSFRSIFQQSSRVSFPNTSLSKTLILYSGSHMQLLCLGFLSSHSLDNSKKQHSSSLKFNCI